MGDDLKFITDDNEFYIKVSFLGIPTCFKSNSMYKYVQVKQT